MKPDRRFLGQPKTFWANVRTISEQAGYTVPREGVIRVPTLPEMIAALQRINLEGKHLADRRGKPTQFGAKLRDYYEYRADVLNNHVEPRLMDADRARKEFARLLPKWRKTCPLPLNKQKGEKRAEAYLTCIVNMLI